MENLFEMIGLYGIVVLIVVGLYLSYVCVSRAMIVTDVLGEFGTEAFIMFVASIICFLMSSYMAMVLYNIVVRNL